MARAKITLSRSALQINYGILSKKVPGKKLLPMLKANAYGHDAIFSARSLLKERLLHGFGVATFAEGIALREGLGASSLPILVFSDSTPWTEANEKICLRYRLEPVIGDQSTLQAFQSRKQSQSIPLHLEVNTGMNRLGLTLADLNAVSANPASVFTHLAESESPGSRLTRKQMGLCEQMVSICRNRFPSALLHFANSGGIWNANAYSVSADMDLVRPGLALYGIRPSPHAKNEGLRPVLTLKAPVIHQIFLKPGDRVGYGGTYRCKNPRGEWISILAVGYADGVFRSLSQQGIATLGKKTFGLRGRVSMDMCAMSSDGRVKLGDWIQLWGEGIDPHEQAKRAGTIPYEFLTRLSERVERIYE